MWSCVLVRDVREWADQGDIDAGGRSHGAISRSAYYVLGVVIVQCGCGHDAISVIINLIISHLSAMVWNMLTALD